MIKKSLFCLFFLLFFSLQAGLAEQPKRVLPMAPNLVETVFALGAGDLVVGFPAYTAYPPEALGLPLAGGYFNPNFERIAVLKPDLVLVQGRHEKLQSYCRRMKIPVLALAMEDRASIQEGILILGKALGKEKEAEELSVNIEKGLDSLSREFHREKPVRVLLVLGRTPGTLSSVMTAGKGSFLTELVSLVGGENIFADQLLRYPTISKEAILVRKPEVILEFLPGTEPLDHDAIKAQWRALGPVPAVQNHRIIILRDSRLLSPGPRIVEAAFLLGDALEGNIWMD